MKSMITKQVFARQITDWLKHQDDIIFEDSLCSQDRCIRFSTFFLNTFFHSSTETGYWGNKYKIIYELHNEDDSLILTCSVSPEKMSNDEKKLLKKLLVSCKVPDMDLNNTVYYLSKWEYDNPFKDVETSMQETKDLYYSLVTSFEKELQKWKTDHSYILYSSSDMVYDDGELDDYHEGSEVYSQSVKYERNLNARKQCIAYHGAYCHICGFDFGKKYGMAFKNTIEVHHIVPLSKIKKDYIVNPIEDLIPVCSNCHTVIHSRKDRVLSPEEVRQMINDVEEFN